jgi:hypothetical protein
MDLHFREELLKDLRKAGCQSEVIQTKDSWDRAKDIDTKFIAVEDFSVIKVTVKKEAHWQWIENRRIFRALEALEALHANGAGNTKVKRLDLLAEVLTKIIGKTPHKWVFQQNDTLGCLLPYFVSDITYSPPDRRAGNPAQVCVTLEGFCRGNQEETKVRLYAGDLRGPILDVLEGKGLFIETPKLVAVYEEELVKHRKYAPLTGTQFLARGVGCVLDGRWSRGVAPFEREGIPAKVVMDDGVLREGKPQMTSCTFWAKNKDDEDAGEETAVTLPEHPLVLVFNLRTHDYVTAHVTSLTPYVYDAKMAEKLVLPGDTRTLIDTLTADAAQTTDDIIQGKGKGIIVICSGPPGTGKTLTAEVYSEAAERPLYVIQCSQLGTTAEGLEKALSEALDRAVRWKAILLIDEADVYIHERGSSIDQNAVVGVFLRLLEYYTGVLFLTTNRATVVDDAIISRMIAHVRYTVPEAEADVLRLWQVLAYQFQIKATDKDLRTFAAAFPGISGRSIKQLFRLAKLMADRQGKGVGLEMLKAVARFQDFPEKAGDASEP